MEPLKEGKKGSGPKVINYGILPLTMDKSDPLQMLNARIVKITVIAHLKIDSS
jgi:hypothetical protein